MGGIHLLIRQVVQSLEHQDANNQLGWLALTPIAALHQIICPGSQLSKFNESGNDLQWVANLIELAFATAISKHVELQGTAWGDHALTLSHTTIDSGNEERL